jgi:multidrug resistance protein, MATE family
LESSSRKAKWLEIIKIAWPLIVANSFWNIQLTIDRVFLGQYSTEALGAAMAVMGVFWTPMALLQQTSAYVTTFVAQYFGAKRFNMIGPALWQALYVGIIGGALFMLLIYAAEPIFNFIAHEEKTRLLEIEYFKSLCYSAMPTAIVAAVSGYYTGLGNTKIIIAINCVGLVGNAILDYLLIFGNFGFPQLGVAGAGYATAIATWFAAFYGLWLIFKDRHAKEYAILQSWRIDTDLMKRFIKYGLPSGLQWALEGLAFTVFLIIVGRMPNGTAALAASGIVVTVMMLSIMPTLGMAQAVMVLVGQHLGEKNPTAAEESTWSGLQVAAMYIAMMGVSFLLIPQFYLSWFHNDENAAVWSQVSVIVPILLAYVALFTLFDSMNLVFSFALKGAGDTRFVTFVALLMPWPFMVLPTWFMKDWDGAIYWAWAAASLFIILQAFVFLARFKGGKWKQMSVIN